MSQNRIIGRVLSVDNFRVFIKIEEDLKPLTCEKLTNYKFNQVKNYENLVRK